MAKTTAGEERLELSQLENALGIIVHAKNMSLIRGERDAAKEAQKEQAWTESFLVLQEKSYIQDGL